VIESRGILPLNRRVEKPVEAAQTVRQRSLQQLKAGYALVVQRNDLTIENG